MSYVYSCAATSTLSTATPAKVQLQLQLQLQRQLGATAQRHGQQQLSCGDFDRSAMTQPHLQQLSRWWRSLKHAPATALRAHPQQQQSLRLQRQRLCYRHSCHNSSLSSFSVSDCATCTSSTTAASQASAFSVCLCGTLASCKQQQRQFRLQRSACALQQHSSATAATALCACARRQPSVSLSGSNIICTAALAFSINVFCRSVCAAA